jgi:predicted PurR-regulated permease PerM
MSLKTLLVGRQKDAALAALNRIALFSGLIVLAIITGFGFFAATFCICIVCSTFLAILLDPLVVRMERAGLSRSIAAGITLICGVLLVAALAYGAYQKVTTFALKLPQYSGRIRQTLAPVNRKLESIQRGVETVRAKPRSAARPVQVVSTNWTSYLLRGVGSISSILIVAAMVPFLVFFMLTRKAYMYFRMAQVFRSRVDFPAFAQSVSTMLGAFTVGFSLLGIGTAAVSYLVFLLIGLKGAVTLALVSGFLNLIPYLGAILAMILPLGAGILQFSTHGPLIIIAVTILALHIIGTDLVIPRWIGPQLQIGPAAVIVGMLFWGWLWGVIGIVLAVPLTALLKLLLDQYPDLTMISDFLADTPHFAEEEPVTPEGDDGMAEGQPVRAK